MLRSNINTERSDFNKIKDADHIEMVWQTIEKNIPEYFQKMIDGEDEFAELKANASFTVKATAPDVRKRLADIFEAGLQNYLYVDSKYKRFFGDESMQEFEDEDNPKAFRAKLAKEVPLIRKALKSKFEAMKEWQERFKWSNPADVYAIFFNLIVFLDEFKDEIRSSDFAKIDDLEDLEKLFKFYQDDDYNVPGVIGMGIKSSVLYFLEPRYFLPANKNTLYSFYFLSDCNHFHLPTHSNEFIMINDINEENNRRYNRNFLIDQNYWYPYDLFILYSLRAYRLLEKLCLKENYKLKEEYRFVHLNTFMSQIWNMKIDVINTMTGGDQEEAR